MVDVAALVLEIDSRPLSKAKNELKEFTAETGRAEAAVKKLTATQMAMGAVSSGRRATDHAATATATAGAYEQSTRRVLANMQLERTLRERNAAFRSQEIIREVAQANAAAEAEARASKRAADAAIAAARERAREVQQARALEAKAMAERVAADKAYERAQAQMAAQVAALKSSVDPLAAAQDRVNAEMVQASTLYKAGALSAAEYERATTILNARLAGLADAHSRGVGSTKAMTQATLGMSRQLADVGVQAAMGTNALMIAIMQGPQMADAFATAKTQGVGFKDVLGGIAKGALGLIATWGPLLLGAGAIAGAFMLWRKHADEVKAAQERMTVATARLAEGQEAVRSAFSSAADFAERYKVANVGLTAAIDGIITSQNAAYGETLRGVGAMDAASQAAVRRAEMERLATVAILKRAAAEAEARAKTSDEDAKKARGTAHRAGFWTGMGQAWAGAEMPTGADPLATAAEVEARRFRELGGEQAWKDAAAEREYAAALKASADELMRAKLTLPDVEKARTATATAGERAAKKEATELRRATEATADYVTGLEQQLRAVGQTSEGVRRLTADREIEAALNRGDMDSALRIKQLILETEKMEELAKVLEEVAKHRKVALESAQAPLITAPTGVVFDKPDEIAEMAREFEAAARAAADIRYSVDDVYYGIREKNWAAAFAGLFNVIKQLQAAFDTTASKSQRMGAVGGVLTGVGGAVGGKAGGAISSVGSGFSAYSSALAMKGSFGAIGGAISGLAGPIGIAVAGFSLLSSVLSSDKAKKRAKLEQEARDMENARAAALEEANRQAELQLRILELSGDEIGALTKRREAELATLNGASRALAEYVHALEDWVKAVDLAKDAVSKAQDDLRAAYEADRDRLLGIIGGVETARDRLNQAYQRERGVIEGTISSVRSLIDSLSAFRVEMDMMAVANDPSRQYGYASSQFATASNDNLIERGRAFAEASQSASATELDFQRDLAAVRRRTDEASKTTQTQLTTAERQLLALDAMVIPLLGVNDNLISVEEAIRGLTTAEQMALLATEELARLDAQVGALIAINSSVLSVAQAVSNLNGAISALASAQASKPAEGASGAGRQVVGAAAYVDMNPDLAALYASGSGMAAGRTKEQFGAYHWERYGQGESRTYAAFAAGGDHMGGLRLVGEEGPELEATGPSRIFSARQTAQMLGGDNSEVVAELRSLREEVAKLRLQQVEDNRQIKRNTKDSAQVLGMVTQGGDAIRTVAA